MGGLISKRKPGRLMSCADSKSRRRGNRDERPRPSICQASQGQRGRSANSNYGSNSRFVSLSMRCSPPYHVVPGFCTLLDRETLLNEIMTSVEDLVSDASQHVRAALGTQISGLAPILGKDELVLFESHISGPWLTDLEPSPIFYPCSSRCSKTNSPTYDYTLSPSSN